MQSMMLRCHGHAGFGPRLVSVGIGAGIPLFLITAGLYFLEKEETVSALIAGFLFFTVCLPNSRILWLALSAWPTLAISDQGLAITGFFAFRGRAADLNWQMSWADIHSMRIDGPSGDLLVLGGSPEVERRIHFFRDFDGHDQALQTLHEQLATRRGSKVPGG